jgi:hypothetical protein
MSDNAVEQCVAVPSILRELQQLFDCPNQTLRIAPNGFLAVVDVAMFITSKTLNVAGEVVRRLFEAHPELQAKCLSFKFSGRGQQPIATADIDVILQIIMLLPGVAASSKRQQAGVLIRRYVAGDEALHGEIDANRAAQEAIQRIPEEQRTPAQQFAAACAERTRMERPRLRLEVYPKPEGLLPPLKERDLYVMLVVELDEQSACLRYFWKIGRSDQPVARASQLHAEAAKRDRSRRWHHSVVLIFAYSGDMEACLHVEFGDALEPETTEYFSGDLTFPQRVRDAWERLVPQQLALQSEQRRRSELQFGDDSLKRRREELELRKAEDEDEERKLKLRREALELDAQVAERGLKRRRDEMELEAAEALSRARTEAEVKLILARGDAEAARLRADAAATAAVYEDEAPAPSCDMKQPTTEAAVRAWSTLRLKPVERTAAVPFREVRDRCMRRFKLRPRAAHALLKTAGVVSTRTYVRGAEMQAATTCDARCLAWKR